MKDWGEFTGDVKTAWLSPEPRLMEVLEPLTYRDPSGKVWPVNGGELINGASVPWFLRRIFPCYIGRYRRATVFHDVYCATRKEPSRLVHQMFYSAMRCDGVGPIQAWLFWEGCCVFGPRFDAKPLGEQLVERLERFAGDLEDGVPIKGIPNREVNE